jgi:hypothetical protein
MENKGANGSAASHSFVLRGYVRHWLGNVWQEYDRVSLPEIVEMREPASGRSRHSAKAAVA